MWKDERKNNTKGVNLRKIAVIAKKYSSLERYLPIFSYICTVPNESTQT